MPNRKIPATPDIADDDAGIFLNGPRKSYVVSKTEQLTSAIGKSIVRQLRRAIANELVCSVSVTKDEVWLRSETGRRSVSAQRLLSYATNTRP